MQNYETMLPSWGLRRNTYLYIWESTKWNHSWLHVQSTSRFNAAAANFSSADSIIGWISLHRFKLDWWNALEPITLSTFNVVEPVSADCLSFVSWFFIYLISFYWDRLEIISFPCCPLSTIGVKMYFKYIYRLSKLCAVLFLEIKQFSPPLLLLCRLPGQSQG